ncbi:hypothetical protein VN12_18025 [Pirellula sp. SH-Sr6A]|nr:hypothetical protein VN12_18025 [Pirellula sp. SH-Sr6A]
MGGQVLDVTRVWAAFNTAQTLKFVALELLV